MPQEIERKYLVIGDAWRNLATGTHYRQGYLNSAKERTVRIRTIGEKAFLTIKSETRGIRRQEYEYPIPYEGQLWEIDEFLGENAGLIVAEIELADENQTFSKPAWIGKEVSADPRYYNANLVQRPYRLWDKND